MTAPAPEEPPRRVTGPRRSARGAWCCREGVTEAAVLVRDHRIAEIGDYYLRGRPTAPLTSGTFSLLPGLVDTHVHVNEPGRDRVGRGSPRRRGAALAGGITTIMRHAAEHRAGHHHGPRAAGSAAAAAGQCAVDVAFWGGAVPGNLADLPRAARGGRGGGQVLPHRLGPARVPGRWRGRNCAPRCRRSPGPGAPMIVHAEDPSRVTVPADASYDAFVALPAAGGGAAAIETVISAAAFGARGAHRAPGRG